MTSRHINNFISRLKPQGYALGMSSLGGGVLEGNMKKIIIVRVEFASSACEFQITKPSMYRRQLAYMKRMHAAILGRSEPVLRVSFGGPND